MSIAITDGHTVAIHYSLTLHDGAVAEDTQGGEPYVFVQGERSLPPGLERDLVGLRAGDERELTLAPADGFGVVDRKLERTVERSMFPTGVELEAGMSFGAQSAQGVTQVWIKDVRGDEVVVTQNHPLAGQSLIYRVRVVDVRQAAEESAEPPST
ncbi:MAG: peptidylprolyl isomerase [Planctomycetota bacterium]|nr:peptidylprolyl isomerase [Planctomycetota bacterium]